MVHDWDHETVTGIMNQSLNWLQNNNHVTEYVNDKSKTQLASIFINRVLNMLCIAKIRANCVDIFHGHKSDWRKHVILNIHILEETSIYIENSSIHCFGSISVYIHLYHTSKNKNYSHICRTTCSNMQNQESDLWPLKSHSLMHSHYAWQTIMLFTFLTLSLSNPRLSNRWPRDYMQPLRG